jgi:hypothetical protein
MDLLAHTYISLFSNEPCKMCHIFQISLGIFLTNVELPELSWSARKINKNIFYSLPGLKLEFSHNQTKIFIHFSYCFEWCASAKRPF